MADHVSVIDVLYNDGHSRKFLVMKITPNTPQKQWLRNYVLERFPNKEDLKKVHIICSDVYVSDDKGKLEHELHRVLFGPDACASIASTAEG